MNKKNLLLTSGLSMTAGGILILLSESIGVNLTKILVPIAFAIGGILAISFANANKQHKIARSYHLMQGFGMLVFSIILFSLSDSLKTFLMTMTYFILLFGIIELIVGFSVLSSNHKINNKIFTSRLVTGVVGLVGGFILYMDALSGQSAGILIAGIITCLGGLSFSMLALKMK